MFGLVRETIFQCPNCSKVLKQGEKQYFCSKGHSFDISKKGYVNLLIPGHTGAGTPGDSKEMLQSRREFLDKGYYEEFSNVLNDIVLSALSVDKDSEETISILDAGCGEGYYLCRLKNSLTDFCDSIKVDVYGIDVSKDAIHYASGRNKGIRFAVASNYHIPVLKGALDCILCSFAPRDEGEFRRILKPKGKLIVASPGARHLYSIREALYESPEEIGQKGTVGEGFTLLAQRNVNYEILLKSKQDILNLFTMTPYSRHAEIDALEKLSEFATEVDINIFVYQKECKGIREQFGDKE